MGYLLSVERNVGCFESQRLAVKAIILPLFLVRYESDIFINSVMAFLEVGSIFFVVVNLFSMDIFYNLLTRNYRHMADNQLLVIKSAITATRGRREDKKQEVVHISP